ncbi:MAG: hypothetical protein KDD11_16210 [Acidobacteria bacterium]|nr:hypothetical protein [Acidobacteriota bacterium]
MVSKSFNRTLVKFTLAGFAVLAALGPTAYALGQPPFSIPVSPRVLKATVVLPDEQESTIQVRDGGMITLRDKETGDSYYLVPVISSENPKQVDVMVLRGLKTENGEEGIEQVGDQVRSLEIGNKDDRLDLPGAFSVRFVAITERIIDDEWVGLKADDLMELSDSEGHMPIPEGCCVNCGSYTICGCAVSNNCGSCCSDGCCGGVKYQTYP